MQSEVEFKKSRRGRQETSLEFRERERVQGEGHL